MAVLEVSHLKYRYPLTEAFALNDISFRVEPGEFIGIIGRSNAGKSTLCDALVGIVPSFYKGAYGGKVLVDGMEVARSEIADVVKKVGIVFQNPFSQITGAKDTVYEEIAFGLENMGIPRAEMIVRIDEALCLLDIYAFRDRPPFSLSGGQMQRMAIAGIIAMRPEIIVLDEPTSQLDPQGSREVFQAVSALSKKGVTVVLVEHKMEELAACCDRIMLLDGGELVALDTPERLFSRDDLAAHGVRPPAYTGICQRLGLLDASGYPPVTLEGAAALLIANGRGASDGTH